MERTLHIMLYRTFHISANGSGPECRSWGSERDSPSCWSICPATAPCHQKQLADYFDVDPANVSRMIDSLEKGGFVLRRPDEHNRRRDLVEVTEKGRQAGALWQERCGQVDEIMLRGFAPEERARFADYLTRAYQNVLEETGRERT